jgi:hypothetical protein
VAGRKVLNNLFPDPAAFQKTRLGVGEAPLEVGNDTIISRLAAEVIRILEIELLVGTAYTC